MSKNHASFHFLCRFLLSHRVDSCFVSPLRFWNVSGYVFYLPHIDMVFAQVNNVSVLIHAIHWVIISSCKKTTKNNNVYRSWTEFGCHKVIKELIFRCMFFFGFWFCEDNEKNRKKTEKRLNFIQITPINYSFDSVLKVRCDHLRHFKYIFDDNSVSIVKYYRR